MQWGPETDAKLFMHVLAINKVKIDYQALATAMGNDCTPKAIMHRMAKLRTQAAEHSTAASASSPGLALPIPVKRGPPMRCRTPAATLSPTSTNGSKKKAPATIPSAATKKVTTPTAPKKGAAAIKSETASTGTKRTASGKAKVLKGSPLKLELSMEDEVETPSKKPKISNGNPNPDLNAKSTAHANENAGEEAV